MMTLLLVVIYLAFISLGLPDSLLGSAWPTMYAALGVSVSAAGILSMLIAGGTIVSSLLSDRLIRRFGAAKVTTVSVAMTAAALLGFSLSGQFWQLCLWCLPYGLGAGSVDAALNNFVALHFGARHMSWLHCFWGVGATVGPWVMGLCLAAGRGWHAGYRVIGLAQVALVVILAASLPLWKMAASAQQTAVRAQTRLTIGEAIALPGAKEALTGFFFYCALEATTGLWASSYLVLRRGLSAETAASWASMFYFGITAGRLLSGFVSEKLGDRAMVRIGCGMALLGAATLLLPLASGFALAGLVLLGLGCAPVFPSLLHATPVNFGAGRSQSLMGLQMASAYIGTTLMPPLFGYIGERFGMGLYPFFLLAFGALLLLLTERLGRVVKPQT